MHESGVIENIKLKYNRKEPSVRMWHFDSFPLYNLGFLTKGCLGDGVTALGLENLLGIFLFFAATIGLVCVIFIIELFRK